MTQFYLNAQDTAVSVDLDVPTPGVGRRLIIAYCGFSIDVPDPAAQWEIGGDSFGAYARGSLSAVGNPVILAYPFIFDDNEAAYLTIGGLSAPAILTIFAAGYEI